ncbi:phenylacetic acid degradation protein [Meiothermus granaticius]|uniref:1,2-phenylacetyl-CoA epoxidase, subunit B n=1 Tax=Meiothermus granaticius NBRC 107808 TaxID=1227551 RepID=A0A399FB64_9DEIN|nr:phenylacetic acid degradation protein [Meiothermus granaticius]RIH93854.1 1,2-phenylacetyl-CoA epoxidase, subunit B [Meiothermus granaticius NBRC 107808]GEM86350.1 phenylacetic acid degradation protein [Meiothermus granaticius NBRC 107808]
MSDTQWPRWEVFKQDTPNKPHQAVGSVHAADPLHALLTARNVFVRRPQAVSLWVAPASAIFSVTQEELAEGPKPSPESTGVAGAYLLFRKTSHKRSMTFVDYVGQLEAPSPQAALEQALRQFTDAEALAWWVIPASSVVRSEESPETVESWFAPAKEKTYKQQSYYGVVGTHTSKLRGRGGADES